MTTRKEDAGRRRKQKRLDTKRGRRMRSRKSRKRMLTGYWHSILLCTGHRYTCELCIPIRRRRGGKERGGDGKGKRDEEGKGH